LGVTALVGAAPFLSIQKGRQQKQQKQQKQGNISQGILTEGKGSAQLTSSLG